MPESTSYLALHTLFPVRIRAGSARVLVRDEVLKNTLSSLLRDTKQARQALEQQAARSMTDAPDLLDRLWEATALRFGLRSLMVVSKDGALLRALGKAVPELTAMMLAAAAVEAPKIGMGKVTSTTVYFDHLCVFVVHCGEVVLAFVGDDTFDTASVAALAKSDYYAILSVSPSKNAPPSRRSSLDDSSRGGLASTST